jgi:hypothetical protein
VIVTAIALAGVNIVYIGAAVTDLDRWAKSDELRG